MDPIFCINIVFDNRVSLAIRYTPKTPHFFYRVIGLGFFVQTQLESPVDRVGVQGCTFYKSGYPRR